MTKNEEYILKSYLVLPSPNLLNHELELENDYLAGYVSRFLKGENFDIEFKIFDKAISNKINDLISKNINNYEGRDLLTYFLTVKLVCNILNKYQKN